MKRWHLLVGLFDGVFRSFGVRSFGSGRLSFRWAGVPLASIKVDTPALLGLRKGKYVIGLTLSRDLGKSLG